MTAGVRIGALCAALAMMLVGLAAPAAAAPYTPAAGVSVGRSNPCHGSSLVVSGTGYVPGSTVTIVIDGTRVGRAEVGAGGTFTVTVTVPDASRGPATVTATGSSGGRVATTAITVGDCGLGTAPEGGNRTSGSAGAGGAGPGGSGTLGANGNRGGLSSTGVAVLGLLVVAAGLVGVGAALIIGGRRRLAASGAA